MTSAQSEPTAPDRSGAPTPFVELFNTFAVLWLKPETEGAVEGLERLVDVLGLKPPFPLSSAELQKEYARLFLGVGPETVSLCESTWTSPLRLVCQEAQFECRRAYAAAGLAVPPDSGIPDDHLGMTAAFLAVSIEKGAWGAARAFAANHPAKWVPAVAAQLAKRPDARIYRTVAEGFLKTLDRLQDER